MPRRSRSFRRDDDPDLQQFLRDVAVVHVDRDRRAANRADHRLDPLGPIPHDDGDVILPPPEFLYGATPPEPFMRN